MKYINVFIHPRQIVSDVHKVHGAMQLAQTNVDVLAYVPASHKLPNTQLLFFRNWGGFNVLRQLVQLFNVDWHVAQGDEQKLQIPFIPKYPSLQFSEHCVPNR